MEKKLCYSKLTLLFLLIFLVPAQLFANEQGFIDFSNKKFAELNESGDPVVLDFYASWCSTCRKQAYVLSQLLKQDKFKNINILKVNYDDAADLRQKYQVPRQSTLIMFLKGREVDRVIAATDKKTLSALLASGLPE